MVSWAAGLVPPGASYSSSSTSSSNSSNSHNNILLWLMLSAHLYHHLRCAESMRQPARGLAKLLPSLNLSSDD